MMGFSRHEITAGGIGVAGWAYWTYRIVRGLLAAGGIGTYWAARGLLGKIALVIWVLIAVQVVAVVVFAVGALLFLGVQAVFKATVGRDRSTSNRKP